MRCQNPSSFTEATQARLHAAVAKRLTSLSGKIERQHETERLNQTVAHLQRLGLQEHQIVKHIELMPKPKTTPAQKIDKRTGQDIEITRLKSFKRNRRH